MAKRKAPRTAFKPGHKKVGGRKKGVQNKFTRDIKEALINAFNKVGGEDYLTVQAKRNARSFMAMLTKALPAEVTGKDGGPIALQVEKVEAGLANLTDAELKAFQKLTQKILGEGA
jgi:hypothetical protein